MIQKCVAALAACFLVSFPVSAASPTIVVHGGAGALEKGRYTEAQEAEYKAKLAEALNAGYAVLEGGGSALDAVEATIVILEDSPLFNAGKGAVFTREGKNELDASIMDGATLNAGAVAGVTQVKNPIRLARKVMENSEHVMFAREGAEMFAKEQGVELVPERYFFTEARWKSYKDALKAEKEKKKSALPVDFKYGTVGAVALDRNGNLAAGTSTGGMTLKRYGRVGDSPIIGAGTFADNKSCAVSSTGWGEYFIRLTIARDICAQVEYAGKSVTDAANDVIFRRLAPLGGDGGVIVLGANGEAAMVFNSKGMFRGVKREGAEPEVAIYGD
ncbi:MAG: isoaspartyl peptidase/L-asparaginase [Pseudomonadota bacterium]|nr:isoaspartyl peptidase/L-asparaginase [Pseudomonadota bacterium]